MTNIAEKTNLFIIKNPVIARAMTLGIVNNRKLARLIMDEENISSEHGVISALRRYSKKVKDEPLNSSAKLLQNSRISTKSRLAIIKMDRDFQLLANVLPVVLKLINPSIGGLLRLVEGRESFKLIVDMDMLEKVEEIVGKDRIHLVVENLAEINIHLGEGYRKVRGARGLILQTLALLDVRVGETISCLPEFILLVDQNDVGKAQELLLRLFFN